MQAQPRHPSGLLLMPPHTGKSCLWCSTISRRNRAARTAEWVRNCSILGMLALLLAALMRGVMR